MKKSILLLLLLPMLASAQYFDVFDIDTSSYPIMKAKFFSIDASGKQILNHTPADFEITENGEPRDVISVSCPEQKNEPFSVVIAVDISGSMLGDGIQNAKEAINSFIDMIPNNGSEIAIIAFNGENYYVSDFSTNKIQLKTKVNALKAGGGTDFDAAFINPVAGALLASEKAKHQKKSIVIVTDGYATGNEIEIINNARNQNVQVFSIIIEQIAPEILSNVSNETEGKTYIKIITKRDFDEAFLDIRNHLFLKPCNISWNNGKSCESDIDLEIFNKVTNIKSISQIQLNNSQILSLVLDKYLIYFGSTSSDTSVTITSYNSEQTIHEIFFDPINDNYKILTPLPITIAENTSAKIMLRYKYDNNNKLYTNMEIISKKCRTSIGLLKGDKKNPISQNTLELTYPNGGEVFIAGSDTLITWKGISRNETVNLKFSSNNGESWNRIINKVSGNEYEWVVPIIESDSCLIYVEQIDYNPSLPELQIEWEKSFGGRKDDRATSIVQTNDGGYIVAGHSESSDGDFDYWIVKINSNGDLEWEKSFGGSKNDEAFSIVQTSDGGYIVAGSSSSQDGDITNPLGNNDHWIVKLKPNGDLEWEKSLGGSSFDYANSIVQTNDDGYIVAGYNESTGRHGDYWIVKLKPNGDLEWEKSLGGTSKDEAFSIVQTYDEGYVIAGQSKSQDGDVKKPLGNSDYWIVKLNSIGELEWEKSFGGSGNEVANSIVQTNDGGYAIAGITWSKDGVRGDTLGKADYWIVKLKFDGELEWERSLGGSNTDEAKSIIQTNDGGYAIAGYSKSQDIDVTNPKDKKDISDPWIKYDYWIVKLKPNGTKEWEKSLGGTNDDYARSIIQTSDGGYVIAGNSESRDGDIANGKGGYWIVKLAPPPPPLQSDTSDAVFSIIMPKPVIQNNDIDMGQMIVGSTKDSTVLSVICNIGDAPLHVLGVDITGGNAPNDFLIPRGAGDFFLKKGECQDFMIEFTPSALGNRTAVATIRTTIGDFTDTIHIRGVGINPLIEATADVVDFGVFELGNGKDTTVVLVRNVGSTPITITDTRISGPDMEQFTLNTTPVTYTIAAGSDKEFKLNYTAKYGGRTSSILEFHYNGIGSPLRSMLFAEGIGGEVYPQVPDAYVGETVELSIFLGKIKPEGLSEVATNYSATVSYNSTLLAPIDKSMTVTTEDTKSFIQIAGKLSGVSQIAAVPMKVGLGTAIKSGLVITEFQLYDANGDTVDYEIEPGVGEFNVLGICEEGGTRLLNPIGDITQLKVLPNRTSSQTTVEMMLIESGQTVLTIFDQIGNEIETVYSGNPEIGTKEIPLDLSNYANGRYYIKLTTPTITKTEILEVVK